MLDALNALMTPLYYAVSAIMVAWHWLLESIGMNPDSGWTWALSIVGLTVTIRALLIPLFVKQIKSSRNMQLLQPKIKELQKKYSHDREKLAQEQMKLWKDTGTNPFASCLPLILQMPIFFALFRVIDHAANGEPRGILTQGQADSIKEATFLGAQIASRFIDNSADGGSFQVKALTLSLVIVMCITTFMTQRQLMSKNMPKDAMSGPYAQQQKMLLYVLPFVFAVGGVAFPIGVLLYWTTSNAWTMCQQFYVIRNNPAPGTPAFKAKQERDKRHGKGATEDPTEIAAEEAEEKSPPRQQPKRQTRDQRKKQGQPAQNQQPPAKKAGSDEPSSDQPAAKDQTEAKGEGEQPQKKQPQKKQPQGKQPQKSHPQKKNSQPQNKARQKKQGPKKQGQKKPGGTPKKP